MLNIFFALTKLCKRCDHGAVLQFKVIPVNSFVWVLSLVLIQVLYGNCWSRSAALQNDLLLWRCSI
ncbi:hypothetical protein DVH24_028338 [Malus domestica]|uniref:Uncharacterized protein n=1 Tax=Malus domestica TaxID=3750 RepID=A0A498HGC8_MALDO|nr:hypothetical protein DVH24_028338 [Malus domestica]